MAWQGREGVVYVCGEWEHGQLGLPLQRAFHDPTSLDPPPTPYETAVPSSGVRINDKGEEMHPIAVVDGNMIVCRPGAPCAPLFLRLRSARPIARCCAARCELRAAALHAANRDSCHDGKEKLYSLCTLETRKRK